MGAECQGRAWYGIRRGPVFSNFSYPALTLLMTGTTAGLLAEPESDTGWHAHFDAWLDRHSDVAATVMVVIGFLVRLKIASGTFLNPDETLHFLIANQASWKAAYHASLTTAHPPLLIFALYFWRNLGASELVLRLLSVIAGTAFCWMCFKWIGSIFGRTAAWIGLIVVTFLPPMISLSAEVRQYGLLLAFIASAAYFLEHAFQKDSAIWMVLFSVCLYLGILSHYSGFLFAAAIGVYTLLCIVSEKVSAKVIAAWIGGQIGALAIAIFLYVTHLSQQRNSAQTVQAVEEWLRKSYFHPGRDNLLLFVLGRTFGVFQFTFGQLAAGDVAGLVFIIAVVYLLKRRNVPARHASWQLGLLLVLPFAINCIAAIAKIYPYGGTRHTSFLVSFAVAGVSLVVARWVRERLIVGVSVAILIVLVCNLFGTPHRPFMLREDQSIQKINEAIAAIRQQISPTTPIFVDYETSLLLNHYLCPHREMPFDSSVIHLQEFRCGEYRIISADPHTWRFDAPLFLNKWNEMLRTFDFRPDQEVWVVQMGWDIQLAAELKNLPEFSEIRPQSFGRNITMFKHAAGQQLPAGRLG